MKPISLIRSILTVGGWTLLSRGAGFARDMMMAAYLGAGPVADAFNVAFSLPNMFRRFFAEGAFNMAFVPMFAKKLEGGEDAQGFARDAFNGLAAILIAFSVIGTFAMPWLVWAMASGFAGDARFDLAVIYGQIGFNYILFISLVALLSGILNAFGRFTEASFVPVLMNLMFIAAMLLADHYGGGPVGVETIAAALSEARDAIEEVIEPYLLQQGLILRTPRGRMLGRSAWRHLGLEPPRPAGQTDLFEA